MVAHSIFCDGVWIPRWHRVDRIAREPQALINSAASPEIENLVALYDLRYETLLQVIRFAVLILSVIFVWLTMTGRSHYPKWMAILNPIILIILSFVIYVITPALGKYLMPIALNVAFTIFFVASICIARQKGV